MQNLPDFSDLAATEKFFYDFSCDLDRDVSIYISKKTIVEGLTAKQQAKLNSKLVNYIDSTFELSSAFAMAAESTKKRTAAA